jgi:quercetin dioxygenase-like cupin family protein
MKNKKVRWLMTALLAIVTAGYSQKVADIPNMPAPGEVENSAVKEIATDSLCTTFVVWIRSGVKHHFHATHTENVYIIEGEGTMEFGEEVFTVKAGDFVLIPKGKVHAVMATKPMKVLSIQTPQWTTDDRNFVPPIRRPHNE